MGSRCDRGKGETFERSKKRLEGNPIGGTYERKNPGQETAKERFEEGRRVSNFPLKSTRKKARVRDSKEKKLQM